MYGYDENTKYLSFLVGVLIPVAQASFVMLIVFLLGVTLGIVMQLDQPWILGLLIGILAGLYSWVYTFRTWIVAAYSQPPIIRGRSGPVVYPELPEPEITRIAIPLDEGEGENWADLPVDLDRLVQLCQGLRSGKPFSEAAWVGSGRLFNRTEFCDLRDELMKRGFIRWISPKATARGVTLSGPGKAMVEYLAAVDPPTLRRMD